MKKLLIFDIDGTLVERDSTDLMPGRKAFFQSLIGQNIYLALATNQGGPACRDAGWEWSDKYPSLIQVEERINAIRQTLFEITEGIRPEVYMALVFVDKGGNVHIPKSMDPANMAYDGPDLATFELDLRINLSWRKPEPGMIIQAMNDLKTTAEYTRVIGNGDEDRDACAKAGCNFSWAKDFFIS